MSADQNSRPVTVNRALWLKPQGGEAGMVAMAGIDGSTSVREIDRVDWQLLELANGERSVKEIQEAVAIDVDELELRFATLSEFLYWIKPDNGAEKQNQRMIEAALKMKLQWEAAIAKPGANSVFHASGIEDAHRQFEDIETTVSHLFREPHVALDGRTYGEAFCDRMLELGALQTGGRVIEIGCGVGYFACHFLDRLKERQPSIYGSVHYTMFDLSPELQSSQKEQCAEHIERIYFEAGNIEAHDFGGRQFDLIIANEMIADLSVGPAKLGNTRRREPESEAEELVNQYDLECDADYSGENAAIAINVGAIRLLEKLPDMLARGGRFALSEYGYIEMNPRAVAFADHFEYSIHFGHLMQAADRLGLRPELENLGEWLGFDGDFPMMDFRSFETLNQVLLPAVGIDPIPKLPYNRDGLNAALGNLADRICNVRFESLRSTGSLSPFRFFALVGSGRSA